MTTDATSTVRTEIEARLARHADALARGDAHTAVDLYTADAIVRPANLEPVRGHDALREFFTRWFSAMTMSGGRYFTDELHVFDDYAFQLGNYEFTATPKGADPVRDRGSFAIVWRRQPDGTWRYARGIFNSSLPPHGAVDRKGQ